MRRFLVFLCGFFVVAGLRSEPLSQALNDVGTASSVTGADSIVIVQGGVGKKADVNLFETIYQPLDSDLTIFAGITPSANVQSLLGAADYAAIRTQLALVIGTNVQAYDADLTTYAGITPSANVQSLLGAADYAAIRTQLALVIGTNVQAYDADLTTYAGITPSANVQSLLGAASYSAMRTQLGLVIGTDVLAPNGNGSSLTGITGPQVAFADTDNNFTATNVQAAIEELDDTNGSGPNAADGKVAWSQLVGVPAGFADGSDDGSGGSSGTLNTIKEEGSQLGGSDIVTLDFLGADFDLTETPDTEVNVTIAGAITRDTEWDSAAKINAATTDNDFVILGGALGTPSSGTLTNATGLPVAGITSSTSTALGVGSLELGHASDTTLARASAGNVTIEGNAIYRAGGTDVPVADGGTGISSGTSGGIPYFSGTTTIASSAALAANAIVLGGGAGAAPATTTTGTGVVTALGVNVGSSGAFVTNGGALGTPSSGTLTNATGLPVSTGISGLGTGVATWLATPSSANLASAVTGETGSGALVFGSTPTIDDASMTGIVSFSDGATAAGEIRILEDSDNGSNYASFTVPALGANTVYVLPTTDGNSGEFLQTNGSGTLTWAAPAGSGDVTAASTFGTDNVLIKSDGTGKGVQATGISVDDSNNVTGIASVTATDTTAETFKILDNVDQSHGLSIVANEDLAADINLSFDLDGASRTVNIQGNVVLPSGTALVSGGALGTPSSGTLTNATGLPVSTGISGLGTGVATWLATPSSSNLASAVTGETGSGALVFGSTPTIDDASMTGVAQFSDGATAAGQIRILEDSDNGSNYASFSVPALAANTVYLLPADDGDAGEQLQTDGSGNLTWEAAGGGGSLDIDALSAATEGDLDADDVLVVSVDGTESKITLDNFQDWIESLSLTITSISSETFTILDNVDQSHGLSIVANEDLASNVNLNVDLDGASRNLNIQGNVVLPSGTALVSGGALGTPSSGTLTNATGLPVSTGISGLGTGVATFLATPSSANLATALTDETGSGAAVFGTSPTLTTPRFADLGYIADANGNEMLQFDSGASAVNFLRILNSSTGNPVRISADGDDSGISLQFEPKGGGDVSFLATTTQASRLRLYEDADNGINYGQFATQESMSGDRTYRFPDADTTIPIFAQTITFSGPSTARTVTFPDANFTAARTDAANTFTGTQTLTADLGASSVATSPSANDNDTSVATTAYVQTELTAYATDTVTFQNKDLTNANNTLPCEFIIACSDLTTALTTGTTKAYFRAPYAFTVTSVSASVLTAPTGSTLIVDINDSGTTIMSTNKLSIDTSELTSITAATAAGVTDTAIAADAVIAIDIDQIGSTVAGAGLIVTIQGTR